MIKSTNLNMTSSHIMKTVEVLVKNNREEEEAIRGYFDALSYLYEEADRVELYSSEQLKLIDEAIDQIHEIISDEMNHSKRLTELTVKLSEIQPALD